MTTPKLPSRRSASFKKLYASLPAKIQQEADEAYNHFEANPDHPGLNFKQIRGPIYSARIGLGYRALAALRNGYWLWFWIGTHAAYDKVIDNL